MAPQGAGVHVNCWFLWNIYYAWLSCTNEELQPHQALLSSTRMEDRCVALSS